MLAGGYDIYAAQEQFDDIERRRKAGEITDKEADEEKFGLTGKLSGKISGAVAGAAAGSFLGPLGSLIGAGLGYHFGGEAGEALFMEFAESIRSFIDAIKSFRDWVGFTSEETEDIVPETGPTEESYDTFTDNWEYLKGKLFRSSEGKDEAPPLVEDNIVKPEVEASNVLDDKIDAMAKVEETDTRVIDERLLDEHKIKRILIL